MYHDVISAKYLDGYRIQVTFEDGKSGIVDFQKYLQQGGVFSKLRDLDYFKKFEINTELGTITWDNQIDIAPETLYGDATGTPLPDWMESESEVRKTA